MFGPSGPMTSKVKQGSFLGSWLTFPSPNSYNNQPSCHLLVSSPAFWDAEKNIPPSRVESILSGRCWAGRYFSWPRFISTLTWSIISWFQWLSVEVSLDRHPQASGGRPQALTLLGGARFTPGAWDAPFLGECWWDPRNILSRRACPGYGSASDPPKRALCHTRPVGGTSDKHQ